MSATTLNGSCLCGSVGYELTGELLRFLHCHCRRCRKATGTSHATNLILKPERMVWTGDQDNIVKYKLPEAERFGTTFCATCGGSLPREGAEWVVVPAGSLDSEPPIAPQGRIFMSSRVAWSCDAGDLPAYEEYPT